MVRGCGLAAQGAECAIIFAAMSGVRLFVYGSLKRGGRHHDLLKGAVFLGEVETAAGYALESAGPYLELVAEAGAGNVSGELFEISESLLPVLDDFEGDAYIRGEVTLSPARGAGPVAAGKLGFVPGRGETALAYFKKSR